MTRTDTIVVENINHPASRRTVDRRLYDAMRRAYLRSLSSNATGSTVEEILERLPSHLPESLFPGGAKMGWWAKTVQLDLEAKGIIVRTNARPLRLRKASPRA